MLSISNLHVAVGGKPILKGPTLEIPAGEAPAAMGPNGALRARLCYADVRRPS